MPIEVHKGSADHAKAVAEYWNAMAQDSDSWWFGAPTRTPEEIAGLLSQGFSLVVAIDGRDLVGFGLWLGPHPIGFIATSRAVFLRIMRYWCQENPGQRGTAVISARDSRERRWIDELGVAELRPMGHKPLKPGEDRATRKVWTYRAEADLDSLLTAVDGKLAETSR